MHRGPGHCYLCAFWQWGTLVRGFIRKCNRGTLAHSQHILPPSTTLINPEVCISLPSPTHTARTANCLLSNTFPPSSAVLRQHFYTPDTLDQHLTAFLTDLVVKARLSGTVESNNNGDDIVSIRNCNSSVYSSVISRSNQI